ncbi:MAG: tRNA(His) guanylyltransferase Thg1 family protein [Kiritimatiellae bacterium]|nr:tRNA(His) guanylyltransferase Thg1 family protein [Kiritimatiellia bacterium]
MKEYERASEIKLTRRLPMIIRLDGKAFHSWVKKTGCVRPFDHTLMGMMAGLTKYLSENISGTVLGYTQSDEISLLVRDDQAIDTEPWFDKRIQKVVSIASALATYWFNANNAFEKKVPAFFDARAFVLPEDEVRNYFIWRQEDASSNSLSMLAQSLYPHEALQRKKWSELQDLCWAKGHNWNDLLTTEKRGTCTYRKEVEKIGRNGSARRLKFVIDEEIPIFSSRDADMWWKRFRA